MFLVVAAVILSIQTKPKASRKGLLLYFQIMLNPVLRGLFSGQLSKPSPPLPAVCLGWAPAHPSPSANTNVSSEISFQILSLEGYGLSLPTLP